MLLIDVRRWGWAARVATGATVAGVLGLSSGCSSSATAAPSSAAATAASSPRALPSTVRVSEAAIPEFLTLTGTLVAQEDSDVAAGAPGKILSTAVERGSRVRKGDVLARIDARTIASTAAEVRAQAASAEAQAKLAEAECKRQEELFAKGSTSTAEHDRALTQCATARAQAEAARARQETAGYALADTTIRAPFSGIVAERFVAVGEYVRPDTRVVTLLADDELRLELTVPEASAGPLVAGLPVDFSLTAVPGATFHAKVTYVSPAVRRASRDVVVEAQVDNREHRLRPGMFATARVQLGERSLPVVPRSALRRDGTVSRVYVVSGDAVEERLVQVGAEKGDQVGIVAGVKLGEQVVTSAEAGSGAASR